MAENLIATGVDVNAQDNRCDSAYVRAGAAGKLRILTMTLTHGAKGLRAAAGR